MKKVIRYIREQWVRFQIWVLSRSVRKIDRRYKKLVRKRKKTDTGAQT